MKRDGRGNLFILFIFYIWNIIRISMRNYRFVVCINTFISFTRNITNHWHLFYKINYCNNNYCPIVWFWNKYILQNVFLFILPSLNKNKKHIKTYKRNLLFFLVFICPNLLDYQKACVSKYLNNICYLDLLML